MILGITENLLEEEQPADWVFAFSDELNDHLEGVKAARKQKAGGGR